MARAPQKKAPKPPTPPGKSGPHDPEPQAGLVPKKDPGSFVPTMGRGRLPGVGVKKPLRTGLKTYANQVK